MTAAPTDAESAAATVQNLDGDDGSVLLKLAPQSQINPPLGHYALISWLFEESPQLISIFDFDPFAVRKLSSGIVQTLSQSQQIGEVVINLPARP